MRVDEDRLAGPPRWEVLPEGFPAWWVTRYDDVRAVLADVRFTREARRAAAARSEAGLPPPPNRRVGRGTGLLDCDPPRHARLRKSVNFAFVPRRVEQLRPWVEVKAHELLLPLRGREEVDLVSELATPLAAAGMCALIGLPVEDFRLFGPWVRAVHGVDPRELVAAIEAMDAYVEDVVERRRRAPLPQEDLLGAMITGCDSGTGLTEDDLVAMVRSLLVGGYESTAALVATALLRALTWPVSPSLVEEVLRSDPPFPRVQERYAMEDVELGGVVIPRGEPVVADLAAANRDAAGRAHLAFGPGVHHCLGAALARLEAQIAITAVLGHVTPVVAPEDIVWTAGILYGPRALPVRFAR